MNLFRVVLPICGVLLLLMPSGALWANSDIMRISLVEGPIQIKTPETADWGLASINEPLEADTQLWVPEGGRLEIQANAGTYIRLDGNTDLEILSPAKDSFQFNISQGHAYVVREAPEGSVTQVDAAFGTTRLFDRATFRIDILDKYEDVTVYKNYVKTENKAGTVRVNAGETLSLSLETDGELAPVGSPDAWEKWNKDRDDKLKTSEAPSKPSEQVSSKDNSSKTQKISSNLPDELSTYSADLQSSGKWISVPEYGDVWSPEVDANWAPYRDGKWIWRGNDYVWVASEPWGWAPYHYGRWFFAEGTGWCWVPPAADDVHWSPGYVGWVRTPDYVAWVPLAPGEIYYGRGHYDRNSINTTNANVAQSNTINVYKNISVNNGATVVDSKTFATASPKIVSLKSNTIRQELFTSKNMTLGAPAIKPTRASYFASSQAIPQAKLPPPAVRNIAMAQLKKDRPFVKEQSKSVFNPGMMSREVSVGRVSTPRTPGKYDPSMTSVQQKAPQTNQKRGVTTEKPTREETGAQGGVGRFKPGGHRTETEVTKSSEGQLNNRSGSSVSQQDGSQTGIGRSKSGGNRTEHAGQSNEEQAKGRTAFGTSQKHVTVDRDGTSAAVVKSNKETPRNSMGADQSRKTQTGATKARAGMTQSENPRIQNSRTQSDKKNAVSPAPQSDRKNAVSQPAKSDRKNTVSPAPRSDKNNNDKKKTDVQKNN